MLDDVELWVAPTISARTRCAFLADVAALLSCERLGKESSVKPMIFPNPAIKGALVCFDNVECEVAVDDAVLRFPVDVGGGGADAGGGAEADAEPRGEVVADAVPGRVSLPSLARAATPSPLVGGRVVVAAAPALVVR